MFRIRVKMGPQARNNKEWTCCFGLHVHTATVLIGMWHLILNIIALTLLAIMIRNPEMMNDLDNNCDDCVDMSAPALPTPLSKIDPPYAYRDHSLNYHNIDMGGLVCICMIAITLMMIYGAIKGKPSHLLPFFCLQLFDFALTTLTAAGYFCYLQSIHRLIAESHRLPYREKLLQLSPDALVMVVLIAFVTIVFLKAYAIGIVWRCYKYLTLRQHNIRSMLPYIIPHVSSTGGLNSEGRDYSTLLPDYEEAIAQSMKQQPPPSYQVAMSNIQVEPANVDNNNDSSNNNNDGNTANANTNNNNNNNINNASNNNNNNNASITIEDIDGTDESPVTGTPPPPYIGNVNILNKNNENENDNGLMSSAVQSSSTPLSSPSSSSSYGTQNIRSNSNSLDLPEITGANKSQAKNNNESSA
ncbi:lysosomal-associated transmembrane protein 4B isoform X2 [Condylostylus longicornis]|nr:lysosomal-associated transmembrane protein 4B isoform X2 [Condylostylus longicornis]